MTIGTGNNNKALSNVFARVDRPLSGEYAEVLLGEPLFSKTPLGR